MLKIVNQQKLSMLTYHHAIQLLLILHHHFLNINYPPLIITALFVSHKLHDHKVIPIKKFYHEFHDEIIEL